MLQTAAKLTPRSPVTPPPRHTQVPRTLGDPAPVQLAPKALVSAPSQPKLCSAAHRHSPSSTPPNPSRDTRSWNRPDLRDSAPGSRDLGQAPSQPPFPSLRPGGVGAGDFSISSRSNQRFTAYDSKAGVGTPAALTPPGSLLGMQAPGPRSRPPESQLMFQQDPQGLCRDVKVSGALLRSSTWFHSRILYAALKHTRRIPVNAPFRILVTWELAPATFSSRRRSLTATMPHSFYSWLHISPQNSIPFSTSHVPRAPCKWSPSTCLFPPFQFPL